MRPRFLVTGGAGLLGHALLPILDGRGDLLAPTIGECDITRPGAILSIAEGFRPTHIVHLAAETRVDYCEEHPDDAFRVNARGTVQVAHAAVRIMARLVTLSTDYVFDGSTKIPYREYEPTGPLNIYGRSKEEAERAALSITSDCLVVRSSSLFGSGGHHFVDSIMERARRGEALKVVSDQVQSPTWAGHLAAALAEAILSDFRGILHLTGRGGCTWFEFARAILAGAGINASCDPIPSEKLARAAHRPAFSLLDNRLSEEALGLRMPDWHEGLAAFLETEGS